MDNQSYKPSLEKFLKTGNQLPEGLRALIERHEKTIRLIAGSSAAIKGRFGPILINSAAVIAALIEGQYNGLEQKGKAADNEDIDIGFLRQLEMEALKRQQDK